MRRASWPRMNSPTCRQAASTSGEPGQFVASPQPWMPASVSIFISVQLYLIPSTRYVAVLVIRMVVRLTEC